jgi:hypothetical protein
VLGIEIGVVNEIVQLTSKVTTPPRATSAAKTLFVGHDVIVVDCGRTRVAAPSRVEAEAPEAASNRAEIPPSVAKPAAKPERRRG